MKTKRKQYQPTAFKAHDWQRIADFYKNLIGGEPMQKLVQYIREETSLSERLFACTSMHKLVLSIYNPIEWNRETLHINFDSLDRKWYFEYNPKPFRPTELNKVYPEELGLQKFQKFIQILKWQ